jgi:uncharacterized membrane protein
MPWWVDTRLPHRFVLIVGLLYGGGLVFLSPPYSVPDELAHFHRAYHCSQGKLYASKRDGATGDELPSSLVETYQAIVGQARSDAEYEISWAKIKRAFAIPLAPEQQQFTRFANTALYSPVPYLPQSLAILAARRWQPAPLTLFYLARIANLIVYVLLAAAAVRQTPVQKWTMAMVALIPMSVYLAASLSADAMMLGLSLLIVATILKLALGNEKPSRRSLLVLGFLFVLLSLSKQPYLALALLFFTIPSRQFASPARRWLTAGLMIGLPVAIELAWMSSLGGLYVPILPFVDPAAQLRWIAGHPYDYTVNVIQAMGRWDIHSFMIGAFGWLGPRLPQWIRETYWAALGVTAVVDGGSPQRLGFRTRAVVLVIYVVSFAVMATFVYLSWERVGIKSIGGIQPRYLLPLVPLLLLLPRGAEKLTSSRFSQVTVPCIAMLVTITAAGTTGWTLLKRYYL